MDLVEWKSESQPRHPWELARFDFFKKLILSHANDVPIQILDIGSGDAWLSRQLLPHLKSGSHITCWDRFYTPDILRRMPNDPQIHYTSEDPQGSFQWILMLDVLEHIEEDSEFLHTIHSRYMSEDSQLIISVPAWRYLFSAHDVALKHFRRYNPREIRELLSKSRYSLQLHGGLFTTLWIARTLEWVLRRLAFSSEVARIEDWKDQSWKTKVFRFLLNCDSTMSFSLSRFSLSPYGLSWWALCKK